MSKSSEQLEFPSDSLSSNIPQNDTVQKNTSLARREIDTFLGFQDNEPLSEKSSLARKEIDTFLGFVNEPICEASSLARREIDTFCGLQDEESFYETTSLARKEIDAFHGLQEKDVSGDANSLARTEIDTFLGFINNGPFNESTSLARREIDTFYGFEENAILQKVPSLLRKEVDIFRDFKENEIIEIEILPRATFRCLLTTNNDSIFQKFLSEINDDTVATVHFKKSMIYEKYFCLCTDYHALLVPYELTDQINEVLSKIQRSTVFCVTEKDQDTLSSFENHELIKSYASNDDLERIRETLHARVNERFGVFNTAQSVMICHCTTYMTFFYLMEEVLSTYYDLKKGKKKFARKVAPIKEEDVQRFNELYESLEEKVKVIHRSVLGDEYSGIDSSINAINDTIRLTSYDDCIETYKKANQMLKETEESIDSFINPTATRSGLPPLNRSVLDDSNLNDDQSFNDPEFNNIKHEVKSLQNQLNNLAQKVECYSPSRSNRTQRLSPKEPEYQPSSPVTTRNLTPSSPRAMRNRVRSMEKSVNEGDPEAMYSLGACYALGNGVAEDKEKALHYYLLAAEKGNKNAQYAAAACYSYGKGTPVDKEKAFELYLKAAEQGHPKAQFALGHFYEYGQGGAERDHDKAKEWYRKAADQNHSAAIKFLEDCPSEERFVESSH